MSSPPADRRPDRAADTPRTMPELDDEKWADIADLVLNIAREVQTHGFASESAIRLAASERNVLRAIDRNPGGSAGDIARLTGLQRSNLSAAIRVLEEKQLVVRHHDVDDARGVRLYSTDLAASNLRVLRHEWAEMLSSAMGSSTVHSSDLANTVALLSTIEDGLVRKRV